MTIAIRPATSADLVTVGQIHTRARTTAYARFVPADALHAVSAAAMGDWWTQRWMYERETHRMAVAEDDTGAVVGFSYVGPEHNFDVGELYAIHVEPSRQGTGIGQALMDWALANLSDLGWSRAVLWVLARNASARRFYERGGWQNDGVRRTAPIGPALTRQLRYGRPLD